MGHVVDQWMVPGSSGRKVKGPRHGHGKRWLARWVEPGGARRSRAFTTKDAAEAHLSRVDVDVRSGTYVRETGASFEAFARQWLDHQVHQQPGTAQVARGRLERYAFPAFGHKPLQKVTRADVQQLVVDAAGSLAPESVRVLLVYVSAVFAAAVEERLVVVSPCRRINLPASTRGLVVPLTVEQVRHLADRVPAHLRGMVLLGAGTGLRPGELRGLTVDRVEGDRVRVDRQLSDETTRARVVWGPLKTKASYRVVRLAPVTARALGEHLEAFGRGPEGLVFASSAGAPLKRSHASYAWGVASEGLVLPDRSGWHALRHHHASLLIASGVSPRAVADRLGHADPSETLRTYAHLWGSDEERILGAVEGAWGQQ